MRRAGVRAALQIQHHSCHAVLGLRNADLPHQRIRHGDHSHAFGSESWFGAYQIEKEPIGILQTVGANREVPVGLYSNARDIAERPETNRRNARFNPVASRK